MKVESASAARRSGAMAGTKRREFTCGRCSWSESDRTSMFLFRLAEAQHTLLAGMDVNHESVESEASKFRLQGIGVARRKPTPTDCSTSFWSQCMGFAIEEPIAHLPTVGHAVPNLPVSMLVTRNIRSQPTQRLVTPLCCLAFLRGGLSSQSTPGSYLNLLSLILYDLR